MGKKSFNDKTSNVYNIFTYETIRNARIFELMIREYYDGTKLNIFG